MIKRSNIVLGLIILNIIFMNTKSTEAITINANDKMLKVEDYINKLVDIREQINTLQQEVSQENGVDTNTPKIITVSMTEDIQEGPEMVLSQPVEEKLQNLIIDEVQLIKYIEQEKSKYLQENNLAYEKGIWPLEGHDTISSYYGERIHPISGVKKFHSGIDIPAPEGTDILSCDSGVVIYSGVQNGYGNVIKIKHFDGKTSTYAHNSKNLVSVDDIVLKGDVIGKVGSTGYSTGNHVHFEVEINENTINPIETVYIQSKTEGH